MTERNAPDRPERARRESSRSENSERKNSGQRAERVAEQFLLGQGLTLLERNFRRRVGEIDLIMRHGPTVVFVEVRQRRHARYGGAAASVTPAKQRRLWRTAALWLQKRQPVAARIDVVCVRWVYPTCPDTWSVEHARFEWICNAVEA